MGDQIHGHPLSVRNEIQEGQGTLPYLNPESDLPLREARLASG
jgi:hypothetical protein